RERNLGFSGNGAFTRSSAALAEQLNIPASAVARAGEEAAAATREAASGLETIRRSGERSLTRANAELGKTCDALGEQVAALQWQADALARLQRLMLALPADASVRDVLERLARVFADAAGATPVIISYTAPRASQAVCIDGEDPPAWVSPGASAPPAAGETAAPAWAGRWFPAGDGRHAAILCGGLVVGGWILPASAVADARVRQAIDALAPAAGVLLAMAGERAAAIELGEALAGAAGNVARTQEALGQADALASLTALAAGAAHELNNPLAVISGRAQLLREKASDDVVRRSCQIIVDQAQRISDMITSLMELASPPAPAPAAVDVAELLAASARAFYSSEHPKAATSVVDIVCGQDTPPVLVDEQQIRAVLVEAITNAATAAPDSPHVTLTAETDEANHAVILSVHDDGPGMDEQTKARVFTPFFSAQPAGRRPGMGLPRARRYVQANRGRIWIQTSQGDGTTVYVQLPQA
ncbi:MAG: HAMP domain-containing sensor histidine kinase, partial [Planctomycetota bacterium]|nr:HAMP domain-containing sensor histidine kinase [Planctomycetota bacterium]